MPGRPRRGEETSPAAGREARARLPWRRAPLLGACLALTLPWLAGCGGEVRVGASRTLRISLLEYHLQPGAARLRSGPLTIVVQNLGRLTHDLVVAQNGSWVASTRPLWPGQSAELNVYLTPGSYSMFSALLSDQSLGDYGTLTVSP